MSKTQETRKYVQGRPTNGWERGERITASAQVKPGDVLIVLSNRFAAENLVRVVERICPVGDGFDYEYVDCRTLKHSDGSTMFCHEFELDMEHTEYYRAIDRRPKDRRKARVAKLPRWLAYPKPPKKIPAVA